MSEKSFTSQLISALLNVFVIIMSIFVIIALLLKLTGHSPTTEQVLITLVVTLLTGLGVLFKERFDLKIKHLEEKMDLKFDHVAHRFDRLEKQMEYRFSRIEKKLGIV